MSEDQNIYKKIINSFRIFLAFILSLGGLCTFCSIFIVIGMLANVIANSRNYDIGTGCHYNTTYNVTSKLCQDNEEPLPCTPMARYQLFLICPITYGFAMVILISMAIFIISALLMSGKAFLNNCRKNMSSESLNGVYASVLHSINSVFPTNNQDNSDFVSNDENDITLSDLLSKKLDL
jgi:hypothetical protein